MKELVEAVKLNNYCLLLMEQRFMLMMNREIAELRMCNDSGSPDLDSLEGDEHG